MPKLEPRKYRSGGVTKRSKALDMGNAIFTWRDPKAIGHSLKKSVESGLRRNSPPGQSAISTLNFDQKRAGESLPTGHRKILEDAKEKFKALFRGESSEGAGEPELRNTTASFRETVKV